jgi:hypothetical protein
VIEVEELLADIPLCLRKSGLMNFIAVNRAEVEVDSHGWVVTVSRKATRLTTATIFEAFASLSRLFQKRFGPMWGAGRDDGQWSASRHSRDILNEVSHVLLFYLGRLSTV